MGAEGSRGKWDRVGTLRVLASVILHTVCLGVRVYNIKMGCLLVLKKKL